MIRHLRLIVAVLAVGLVGAGLFFFWPHPLDPVNPSASQPMGDALIARGRYLTTAADCAACHTTKGGQPFAGGVAFKLPFGTIYSSNITPDREHGIGAWDDAEFVRAVRTGVGKHGENLYPAFPYTSYALLSTDDVLAIRAYLATLAPSPTPSRANDLMFPFNQRFVLRGWNLLFLSGKPFEPDPSQSQAWNRGSYLVNGLAHCSECHSPRNVLFGRESDNALAGGLVDGWKAWNITSDKETGIGNWTDQALISYLHQGYAVGHGAASGGMREAVDLSLSHLPRSDIEDMVAYLRTVPARKTDVAAAVVAKSPAVVASQKWAPTPGAPEGTGRRVFESACVGCHAWNGHGQQSIRAGLSGAHPVNDPAGANLVRLILQGSHGSDGSVATSMPSFGAAYTDAEIAALSNYVTAQFSGKAATVTAEQVRQAR